MVSGWAEFFVAIGGAAAALTGLLFVAVALRPREIRNSTLMVGRARSAFYAFVTVLFVALLALAGTSSRLIGLAEIGVAVGVFALWFAATIGLALMVFLLLALFCHTAYCWPKRQDARLAELPLAA